MGADVSGWAFRDGAGHPLRIDGTASDITEREAVYMQPGVELSEWPNSGTVVSHGPRDQDAHERHSGPGGIFDGADKGRAGQEGPQTIISQVEQLRG